MNDELTSTALNDRVTYPAGGYRHDALMQALFAGCEALACARARLPKYMVASMIDPARDALRQQFMLRKAAIRNGTAKVQP